MGMDAVFVCIAENYYSKGKAFWLDEEKTKEIVDMYEVRKNLIVGVKAENIILMDLDSNWQSMYDITAKYTVLVFWSPVCGHCKTELPKLHDFYEEWKSKGVAVYAVGTIFDNDKWPEFIKEHGFEWIDVSDNPEINKDAYKYIQEGKTTLNSLNFRDYWDVFSTPQYYLLDENKMIIAKKLNADQLPDFIEKYEKRQKAITEEKEKSKTN
jgi:thiol-disulfide isomerase/thioredoxin